MQLTCKNAAGAGFGALLALIGGCATVNNSHNAKPPETDRTGMVSVRFADPRDLRILVSTRMQGSDGFPTVSIELWSEASDDVLVEYASGSIILHCGPYQREGPDHIFGRRREILSSRESLIFSLGSGNWSRTQVATGPVDLMMPAELARGSYPMWVTFRTPSGLGDGGSTLVESERDSFEVR